MLLIQSTGSREVLRHDPPNDHYRSHDSPIGDRSHEGSRPDTPLDQYRTNDSPKSGDALSMSKVLGNKRLHVCKLYYILFQLFIVFMWSLL